MFQRVHENKINIKIKERKGKKKNVLATRDVSRLWHPAAAAATVAVVVVDAAVAVVVVMAIIVVVEVVVVIIIAIAKNK